jgi:phosphatidylserine decarboxylase
LNKVFNGWIEGLRFYGPVFILGLILSVFLPQAYVWLAGLVLLSSVAMALFFRDFPRNITAAPLEVVSPADGTIVAIEDLDESPHYEGPSRRVSIFLSVLNAHLNRAPYDAIVTGIIYKEGQYRDARDPESSKINESNAVWMDTAKGAMTVRQISGAIARRIVCPVQKDIKLKKGEKFGMIRFGSRTELYLPPGTELRVQLKDKVYAGTSVIAQFQ